MYPRNISLRITMLATALALMAVDAQAQSLTIQNTNLGPVPLSGAVTVDSDGNLQATCSGANCSSLGQSGTPATVSLPVGPIETTQNVQTSVTVDVGNTPITCVGTATPSTGVTGWIGNDLRTTDGNVNVTFANTGQHNLTATCYNASGTAGSDTVTVNVASGQQTGEDPNSCVIDGVTVGANGTGNYELIRPVGFQMHNRTWENQFNDRPFGTPVSYLAPIGSFSVGDDEAAGMYITIPFRPVANVIYNLSWESAQSIPDAGYFTPRSASVVHVSVSPCAGDVRARVSTSTNQWLKACKQSLSAQGSLVFSTQSAAACRLQAGELYWLTILMADPSDGLTTTERSCTQGRDKCEANFNIDYR